MGLLEVRVKPGSKKGPVIQTALDGSLLIFVREQAVDGKANSAVIDLIADYYGLPRSSVQLVSGRTSRRKFFKIQGYIPDTMSKE